MKIRKIFDTAMIILGILALVGWFGYVGIYLYNENKYLRSEIEKLEESNRNIAFFLDKLKIL